MKKYLGLLARSIGLGLGFGLVLAGLVGLLYQALHSSDPGFHPGKVPLYLYTVGGVLGLLAGWALALEATLSGLLTTLFLKIAEKVPPSAAKLGEDWGSRMGETFREVLAPLPGLVKKLLHLFLVVRFSHYDRINEAVEKAKRKEPGGDYSPQWYARVVLGYFLWPVKVGLALVLALMGLLCCILWSLPFFG